MTGRELEEFLEVCPRPELFDRVVLENGALLYRPGDRTEEVLAARPPDAFLRALVARGVGPISAGRVVVATWEPHRPAIERHPERCRVADNRRRCIKSLHRSGLVVSPRCRGRTNMLAAPATSKTTTKDTAPPLRDMNTPPNSAASPSSFSAK